MKIFLTGASGLVGTAFAQAAVRRGHEIIGLYLNHPPSFAGKQRAERLDLVDQNALTSLVLDTFPEVIINAAGVTEPVKVEANPDYAEKLNVALPYHLSQLSHHLSARFLHLSTDMVFDGLGSNYRPTDPPRPQTCYGKQKLAAEKAVLLAATDFSVVLRITLVNGNSLGGHRSLHEKLFATWASGRIARLFTDEVRQPCTAESVAEVLLELSERRDLTGLFHWAGADVLSRFEIGRKILESFHLPAKLIAPAKRSDNPLLRDRNLSLDLHSLISRLKTRPEPLIRQLETLVVPPPFRPWYNSLRT